ncbi:mechanosensitive ion channel family protein [Methanoregula sp.]|uniref:mechanosensitive ion channel family protein n=1 Tax=Methanoregula sp. TaxID=2052170 RepID=UPI003BAF9A90
MVPVFGSLLDQWNSTIVTYVPGIVGALVVLIIGWIVGRLLGRAVRIVLDKIGEQHIVEEGADVASIRGSFKSAGITVGYIGDIAVRIVVYLVAILAAVNILNLDYLSQLMMMVVEYIPHVVAFAILFVVGFILIDAFIDFLNRYYAGKNVQFISPVLVLVRVFLYFVTAILALSQLQLDLTIIYTFVTPIAWGIGIGLGAAIAIIVGFGLRNRSEAIMDHVLGTILKK